MAATHKIRRKKRSSKWRPSEASTIGRRAKASPWGIAQKHHHSKHMPELSLAAGLLRSTGLALGPGLSDAPENDGNVTMSDEPESLHREMLFELMYGRITSNHFYQINVTQSSQ
jgi:hypothetical protein